MTRALAVAVLALAGCAPIEGTTPHQLARSITPGIRIHCDGRCLIYPANVDSAPAPGERPEPLLH